MEKNISVVIITFNPKVEILKENIINLLKSSIVNKVIIVDNGASKSLDELKSIPDVIIKHLGQNRGIATAQNVGLRISQSLCSKYALLLDQDSEIETDLVSKLLDGYITLEQKGIKLAAVGPRPFDLFENKKMKANIQRDIRIFEGFSLTKQIIASGKLINLDVLDQVGFMEDDLFIDGVDHEWCWRAGRLGYKIAIIENAIMKHRLGDARGNFLGFTYKIGSPIRLYYQFRNILVLSRRDYVPLYWKLRNLIGIFLKFIIFSLKESDSKIRRYYMVKGFCSGLKKDKGIIDKPFK